MTTPIKNRRWTIPSRIYREGESTPAPTPTPTSTNDGKIVMTQTDFDKKMAEHKRALQVKNQELQDQLKAAIDSGKLTTEQVNQHETRLAELQAEFATKEELAQTEYKKLQTKYDNDLKKSTDTAKLWETRFDQMLIKNRILEAAGRKETKAFNAEQVVELLEKKARRIEIMDGEGKGTGRFDVKIKFPIEKDGKQVEMDFTPEETLKAMVETPTRYGNLFESGVNGGLGGSNSTNNSSGRLRALTSDVPMEEYVKNRDGYLESANQQKS